MPRSTPHGVPRRWPGVTHALALAARFLVPFAIVSAIVRVVAPPNPDFAWHPTYTVKIDYLRETDRHFDIAFVGNSRAYLAVDPAIVDATMAEHGCPGFTSYNLASVGQTWFEYQHAMDVLADLPGGTPEYVVSVDRALFEIGLSREFTVRNRVHMALSELPDALEYVGEIPTDVDGLKSDVKVADLAAAFAVAQLPLGAIHQRIFDQYSLEDEALLADEWRGFTPWERIRADRGTDAELARRGLDAYVASGQWVERWRPKEPSTDTLDRWVGTIESLLDAMPEGVTKVQALIPSDFDAGTAARIREAWVAAGHTEELLNLVDESLVGDFTDPSYWSDTYHVEEVGAVRISRALGEQMCRIVSADRASGQGG